MISEKILLELLEYRCSDDKDFGRLKSAGILRETAGRSRNRVYCADSIVENSEDSVCEAYSRYMRMKFIRTMRISQDNEAVRDDNLLQQSGNERRRSIRATADDCSRLSDISNHGINERNTDFMFYRQTYAVSGNPILPPILKNRNNR